MPINETKYVYILILMSLLPLTSVGSRLVYKTPAHRHEQRIPALTMTLFLVKEHL